jgi:hypothetical protein
MANPRPEKQTALELVQTTQAILKEFSELLEAVSESIENGNAISPTEARRIRKEWEDLKSLTEGFVYACEQGVYRDP